MCNAQYLGKLTCNFTTIPQYFKEYGCESRGVGKVFHPYKDLDKNDPLSWSRKFLHARKTKWEKNYTSWIAVPDNQLTLSPFADKQITHQAISVFWQLVEDSSAGFHPFSLDSTGHIPHSCFRKPTSSTILRVI